jgi:hypothetical protein
MARLPSLNMANGYEQEIGRQNQRLVWCSQVHHSGFSSRRPGFESRHEHQLESWILFIDLHLRAYILVPYHQRYHARCYANKSFDFGRKRA